MELSPGAAYQKTGVAEAVGVSDANDVFGAAFCAVTPFDIDFLSHFKNA